MKNIVTRSLRGKYTMQISKCLDLHESKNDIQMYWYYKHGNDIDSTEKEPDAIILCPFQDHNYNLSTQIEQKKILEAIHRYWSIKTLQYSYLSNKYYNTQYPLNTNNACLLYGIIHQWRGLIVCNCSFLEPIHRMLCINVSGLVILSNMWYDTAWYMDARWCT